MAPQPPSDPSTLSNPDPEFDPEEEYDDDEEEDPSASMAALMGFSGFGTQASKKRKYNPKTDALIDGQGLESIDRGGKRGKGSGGNQIPLGKTRVLGSGLASAQTPGYVEEVVVQNTDDNEGNDDDLVSRGRERKRINTTGDIETRNLSTTTINANPNIRPTSPRRAELDSVQRQIDAITTRTSYVLPESSTSTIPLPQPPLFTPPSYQTQPQNKDQNQNQNQRGRQNGQGNSNGGRNELWYIGYFDPSFLVNPWEALEKEKGLEARGCWM